MYQHPSESNSDEFIFQGKKEDSDVDEKITSGDVGINCVRPASSTYMFVVRCVSSQPTQKDWRRTAIFHTFIKIGDKNCKVIVNRESCINAVSSKMIEKLRLHVPHPTRTRCHGLTPRT